MYTTRSCPAWQTQLAPDRFQPFATLRRAVLGVRHKRPYLSLSSDTAACVSSHARPCRLPRREGRRWSRPAYGRLPRLPERSSASGRGGRNTQHLHLKKVCGVMWVCTGPAGRSESATRPMRSVGKPVLDHQGEMPLPVVNSLFDALYPPGLQWYWRADFVKELSDEAVERHAHHGAALPTMHSTMHLYAIDGAAHRVGRTETAFSYRDANWAEVIVGVDPDPVNSGKITKWCKDYFDALHPYSAGGAYVNFMMDEGHSGFSRHSATTTRAWPRSRASTIRPTCSGSIRTSARRQQACDSGLARKGPDAAAGLRARRI